MSDAPLLELRSVSKSFGSTRALAGVSFELLPGEVHAVVGENGAGKTTALGCMYGVVQPDSGWVELAGRRVRLDRPRTAQDFGIGCVFQELSLAGSLSVAENIFAGRLPTRLGIIDWPRLDRLARELLAEFDSHIDVNQPVSQLPISTRQIVEIAKALSLGSRILLLDEPTSALTPDEVDALFAILRRLTSRRIGIVYVSHHLSEIFVIADRITVFRDGKCVTTHKTSETTPRQIVKEMIGGDMPRMRARQGRTAGRPVLRTRNLSLRGLFEDVSLDVRSGEIIGLAGLVGSRRSAIAKSLVGLISPGSGTIEKDGNAVQLKSLSDAMAKGISYVPDERKTDGLHLSLSVQDNTTAATLGRHTKWGILSRRSAAAATLRAIRDLSVKAAGISAPVGGLSGGNQQKVMLAKWLETDPDVLIVEEPTKGVDVRAKVQIQRELRRRSDAGMAIIVVSSDFPELIKITDRIVIVRDGRIAGAVDTSDATDDDILRMASGFQSGAAKSPESLVEGNAA